MTNITAQQTAAQELENTVKAHLSNDDTDTGLVRTLVNNVLHERQQEESELSQELASRYENWAYAVKELEFANDTYYNAETGSDEEEEAEQEKNNAEQEVDGQASELRLALSEFLGDA